ncbi:MAG: hypothetical protein ACR2L2_13770 [Acidobacteriota bacterium]
MRRRLVVRPEARRDIEEAALRYEIQRGELAGRLLKELAELFERILSNPLQFPEISQEIRRGPLRRFPYAVNSPQPTRPSWSSRCCTSTDTRTLGNSDSELTLTPDF